MTPTRRVALAIGSDGARLVLSVIVLVGTFALLLMDKPLPDIVVAVDGMAVGYWFGVAVGKFGG